MEETFINQFYETFGGHWKSRGPQAIACVCLMVSLPEHQSMSKQVKTDTMLTGVHQFKASFNIIFD